MDIETTDDTRDELDELIAELGQDQATREAMEDAAQFFRLLETLKAIRKQHGLKQSEIAARMGTTQSAVSKIEGGANDPQVSTLMRYARALDARLAIRALIDSPHPSHNASEWARASSRSANRGRRPSVRPADVVTTVYLREAS